MNQAQKRKRKKRRRKKRKQKNCRLCENHVMSMDFKNPNTLRRYQTSGGKILSRRITGNCFRHQKMLTAAVKRARQMGLAG